VKALTRFRELGTGFENVPARELVRMAELAEDLGYGTFWIPEDYFFRGAFSLAAAVAMRTRTIRIGIGVLNPYTRHPALTAMELGALEELSEGRAVLGVGAGLRSWIEQMGIPYARPTVAMRETVAIVRALFRGETLSHEGQAFRTAAVKLAFTPPRAEVPVHLGVIGPKNLEMAGEIAEGVILSGMSSPAYVRFAVEHLRRGAERSGRRLEDLEVSAFLLISVDDDERRAREAVKPFLATLIGLMAPHPESPLFTAPGISPHELAPFGERFALGDLPIDLVTDRIVDTFAIAGTPDHCRALLDELAAAGVQSPIAFEVPGVPAEQTIRSIHRHLGGRFTH
jgi:5,10-methylenetetrahydromethanopterin reductase